MRYLLILICAVNLSFAGVWSTTSMSIATGTLTGVVSANMATLVAQVVQIKSDFDSKAISATAEKMDYLKMIEGVESGIMIEMRKINENQMKINKLYSKD